MDIFGKDFGIWITLDRYGNVGPDMEAVKAFMESDDCTVWQFDYIMGDSL